MNTNPNAAGFAGADIMQEYLKTLEFDQPQLANDLFGPQNQNLTVIARHCDVELHSRGSTVTIAAKDKDAGNAAANILLQLYKILKSGRALYPADISHACKAACQDAGADLTALFHKDASILTPRKTISPKTTTQRDYIEALKHKDMVFAVGPAGTGKTYLAVAMAVAALNDRKIRRIILTRPAVEAGEKLGFLPGDLAEKINPYLRPLYDALYDLMDIGKVTELFEHNIIEVAPLAFMRGRTLNDAFIILDEAQNTTPEQMKMFLTRMGFGSKVVITGDITQIDLPDLTGTTGAERSGLVQALRILGGLAEVGMVRFGSQDVTRHPLVAKIVDAYDHT